MIQQNLILESWTPHGEELPIFKHTGMGRVGARQGTAGRRKVQRVQG